MAQNRRPHHFLLICVSAANAPTIPANGSTPPNANPPAATPSHSAQLALVRSLLVFLGNGVTA